MSGHTPRCKDCLRAQVLARKESDPDAEVRRRLTTHLKHKFGLAIEAYDAMLVAQGGVCAICKRGETKKHPYGVGADRLAVDHCHRTGKVRALLCRGCNHSMGSYGDDPALLRAMADYVEAHRMASLTD
jgi:hypothetical protein